MDLNTLTPGIFGTKGILPSCSNTSWFLGGQASQGIYTPFNLDLVIHINITCQ